jgi:hypothetical protein
MNVDGRHEAERFLSVHHAFLGPYLLLSLRGWVEAGVEWGITGSKGLFLFGLGKFLGLVTDRRSNGEFGGSMIAAVRSKAVLALGLRIGDSIENSQRPFTASAGCALLQPLPCG